MHGRGREQGKEEKVSRKSRRTGLSVEGMLLRCPLDFAFTNHSKQHDVFKRVLEESWRAQVQVLGHTFLRVQLCLQ